MFDKKVSIIIPVYNAEKTIQNCLESLKAQTYQYLQCIFINDCSLDKGVQKIQAYYEEFVNHPTIDVVIIHHSVNKGVATARNTGLKAANGEFIYFLDADDHLDGNAIATMVSKAEEKGSDIVGINWYMTFENNERKMSQPNFSSSDEALLLMMKGKMRWNLWLFLIRRALFVNNNISFIDGQNMGEDMLVVFDLFMHAKDVSYLDEFFYHYGQTNQESLTKIYSNKHIQEVSINMEVLEKRILNHSKFNNLSAYINLLKLNIKLPLIIGKETSQFILWKQWFPESNNDIWKNDALSLRTKFLQWLALKEQYLFLKLYYLIIIRFVYGIIYK